MKPCCGCEHDCKTVQVGCIWRHNWGMHKSFVAVFCGLTMERSLVTLVLKLIWGSLSGGCESSIFSEVRLCSSLKVNQFFSKEYVTSAQIQHEECSIEWCVPLKRRLTFTGLHGIISQKIEIFLDVKGLSVLL
jgi:hypothetical protein